MFSVPPQLAIQDHPPIRWVSVIHQLTSGHKKGWWPLDHRALNITRKLDQGETNRKNPDALPTVLV